MSEEKRIEKKLDEVLKEVRDTNKTIETIGCVLIFGVIGLTLLGITIGRNRPLYFNEYRRRMFDIF